MIEYQPHPIHNEYIITNTGECYSTIKHKWLKNDPNSCGYVRYWLKNKRFFAHRLVAETFIPNYNELPCVDHMDLNKQNNNINNLRWINRSNNSLNKKVNKNNKLEIKNIIKTPNNTYQFSKTHNGVSHNKTLKTLEECIDYKNHYHQINNLIIY